MNKDNKDNKDNSIKLGTLSIVILIISGSLLLFSFFSPLFFTNKTITGISFGSEAGQIGDTIGGIMNPFVAISGVLLTFLAFYIQFKANRLQHDSFRQELNEQKEQFRKTQFENQFYEMLRFHKENVNEIRINNSTKGYDLTGRQVFEWMKKEFELGYDIVKSCSPNSELKKIINESYSLFFHGLDSKGILEYDYYKKLYEIRRFHTNAKFTGLPKYVKEFAKVDTNINLDYPIFIGYSSQLAHYYRHLFQTVKFIVNQEQKLLSYEEKRKYLRILRAQLSDPEQAMIFYNWLSGFGIQWENETNKFFTDYRMIHNLYQEILLPDVVLKNIFNINSGYLKEKDRKNDYLFEFQDW